MTKDQDVEFRNREAKTFLPVTVRMAERKTEVTEHACYTIAPTVQ